MAVDKIKTSNLFSVLGVCAGLSNALRFPALCALYGYSFFVAYFLSLFVVCLPILCAELQLAKGGRLPATLMRAACFNSLVISLYYAAVTSRLGAEAVFAGADGRGYISYLILIPVAISAYVIIKKNWLNLTGKASVISFFALFITLAVLGGGRLNLKYGSIFCGAMWSDALSQSLLSLSLAGGVMPSFARALPQGFSPLKTSVLLLFVNLAGCTLASIATLPFVQNAPQSGLNFAFSVFPQVIKGLNLNARLFTFLINAALFLVALHSTCSLALPYLVFYGRSPAHLLTLLLFISPCFFLCSFQVLGAVDKMCCSVVAVTLALGEGACLLLQSKSAFKAAYMGVICTILSLFCVFSVCGARFLSYPLPAVICAYLSLFSTLVAAFKNYLTKCKLFTTIKISCGRN